MQLSGAAVANVVIIHRRLLKIFFHLGTLLFGMVILGQLPKTSKSVQCVVVDTDRYSKVARVVSSSRLQYLKTTARSFHSSGHAKELTEKTFTCPRHYFAECQKDCEMFKQLMTHAYNTQGHGSTNATLHSLMLSRLLWGPTTILNTSAVLTDTYIESSTKSLRPRVEAHKHALRAKIDSRSH